MHMIRVGVVRGGTGNQYAESLATGAFVLKNLPRDRYEVLDIFLDREGVWHLSGRVLSPERLKLRVDVIWNALHGFYGEDGKLQQFLDALGVPYIGSGALSSAVSQNGKLLKGHLQKAGIRTPRGVYIESWGEGEREQLAREAVKNISAQFSPPWLVEPISRGQANGAMRANTRDELFAVLLRLCELDIPALVEEAVLGTEASVVAVRGFRKQPLYTFLPVRGGGRLVRLKKNESDAMQKIARDTHAALGLGSYSRMRAVVTPRGHVYVLGIETVPALHADSDVHHAMETLGVSFGELAEHLIGEAMKE